MNDALVNALQVSYPAIFATPDDAQRCAETILKDVEDGSTPRDAVVKHLHYRGVDTNHFFEEGYIVDIVNSFTYHA